MCILDQAGHVEARNRFPVDRDSLVSFAKHELRVDDHVAVEATTNTWPVVELVRPFVADVTVSNPMATGAIAHAKVKTDKIDARTRAQLLRADFLPSVWQPDTGTTRLRQLTNQRASLVAERISIKNRIHAVLHQRLIPLPSGQLFNERGRQWLDQLEIDPDGRAALRRDLHLP
jgi:transposase